MAHTLRPALLEDLPAIVALEAEAFAEGAWSAGAVRGALADPHGRSFVAVDEDGLVGVILGQSLFERAELLRVAVPSRRRRSGLGRALIAALARSCAEAGAEELWLEVHEANLGACALYASEGFELSHRRRGYYSGGGDALLYRRPLGPPVG